MTVAEKRVDATVSTRQGYQVGGTVCVCVCVNLETYDGEMPWKDVSDGRGDQPWLMQSLAMLFN